MNNFNEFNDAVLTTEEQSNTTGGRRRRRERVLNQVRPSGSYGNLVPLSQNEINSFGGRSQERLHKQYNRRVRRFVNGGYNQREFDYNYGL